MNRKSFVKLFGAFLRALPIANRLQFGDKQEEIVEDMWNGNLFEAVQNRVLRPFCCDCLEWVLPAFEAKFPRDRRLRHLLQLTREYADGKVPYSKVEKLRTEVLELRTELWKLPQVGIVVFAVEVALGASAKPITQDILHNLLFDHRWVVRALEMPKEVEWMKAHPAHYPVDDIVKLEQEARDSLWKTLKKCQLKRLTSYLTGKEETHVDIEEGDFMNFSVVNRRCGRI